MKRVLCVVVTYNRLSELKECLFALRNQTFRDYDVVVINNGSTDGTNEFLDKQKDIIVINQSNLGGAGGFYAGMKYGYDNGYDWILLMDDDGLPAPTQIEELLKYSEESWYLNALVLFKDDHTRFAFPPDDPKLTLSIVKTKETVDFVRPFNGTMFSRKLIDKIGLIKKEMFIWGDEKEYTARAEKNGIRPITVTSAVHYHPLEKGVHKYMLPFLKFKFFEILVKPKHLSHYYYRNLGYIDATYRDVFRSAKLVLVHLVYFARKGDINELKKFLKYYFKGRKNIYN